MPKQNSENEFLSRTLKSRVREAPPAPFLEARIWNAIQSQKTPANRSRFWKLAPSLAGVLGIVLAILLVNQKSHLTSRIVSRPLPSPVASLEGWESDFADGFDYLTDFDAEEEIAIF